MTVGAAARGCSRGPSPCSSSGSAARWSPAPNSAVRPTSAGAGACNARAEGTWRSTLWATGRVTSSPGNGSTRDPRAPWWSASMRSAALSNRAAGTLHRARRTAASRPAGTVERTVRRPGRDRPWPCPRGRARARSCSGRARRPRGRPEVRSSATVRREYVQSGIPSQACQGLSRFLVGCAHPFHQVPPMRLHGGSARLPVPQAGLGESRERRCGEGMAN
jgi:hypothetical protein